MVKNCKVILIFLVVLLLGQGICICISAENQTEKRFYAVCPEELDRISIITEKECSTVVYSSKEISWRYIIGCRIKRLAASYNGSYIVVYDERGSLHLLNNQGKRLWRVNVGDFVKNEISYHEYLATCPFCGQTFSIWTKLYGDLQYLGVTKEGISVLYFLHYGEAETQSCPHFSRDHYYLRAENVLFFDKSGNLIWKYESGVLKGISPLQVPEEIIPCMVRFAPFSSRPCVFIKDKIFFPENQTERSLHIAYTSKVSLDGNLIAWGANDYESHKLYVYDRTSEKRWETGFDYQVEDVAISPKSETISVLAHTRSGDLYLYIFDRFGTKLREKKVSPCEEKFYDPVVGQVKITLRTVPKKLAMFNSSFVAIGVPDYYAGAIGIYLEGVQTEPPIWREDCRMLGYFSESELLLPWNLSLSEIFRCGYFDSEGHLRIIEENQWQPSVQISTYKQLKYKSFLQIDYYYEIPLFYRSPIIDLVSFRFGFRFGFPIKFWGRVNPPLQVNLTAVIRWSYEGNSKRYERIIQTNKDGTFYFELDSLLPADQAEGGCWTVSVVFYGNDNFLSTYRYAEFFIAEIWGIMKTILVIFGILLSLIVFKKILKGVRSKTKN
jgi:hypothetical protein